MRRISLLVLSSLLLVALLAGCDLAASNADFAKPLDSAMKAASAGNIDAIWQLSSVEMKNKMSKSQLTSQIADQPYFFKNYQSLTIQNWKVTEWTGEPTRADVGGVIEYTDADEGTFTARLEKDGADWKVTSIDVKVSPARIKKYLQGT
jgi:hypothetical protein